MGAEPASLFANYPAGYPSALVAGRAINLKLFIPPIYGPKFHADGDTHFKERPRTRGLPVEPPCPVCKVQKTRPMMYTPERTKLWEEHVGAYAKQQIRSLPGGFMLPIKEARVLASLRFNIRKPRSYSKSVIHHVVKPDLDNLEKAIYDALVNLEVLKDDAMVTDHTVMKRYPEPGHPAGVEIDLTAVGL